MTSVKSMNRKSTWRMARLTPVAAAVVMAGCLIPVAHAQTAQTPQRPAQAPARPKPVQAAPAPQPVAATQGLSVNPAKGEDDVIARVGKVGISADDVRAYVAALAPREQAAVTQDSALLSQAVRMLLANRLVLQEATAKKWDQQPKVAEQLDRVRESALTELYLQSVSTPPSNFPSEDDLQKVYDANRNAFLMPRQFQIAQIFVAIPKDADKATEDSAKKTVDDVQRKLKSGGDFAALANDHGVKNGGDLGWITESQIRPEIRTQVMGLAKGGVSEAIKLDDGWHVLKLNDTKDSYTRTLPEVRDQLVQQIRNERATMLRRAYLAELLKQTPPAINEIALSKVLDD